MDQIRSGVKARISGSIFLIAAFALALTFTAGIRGEGRHAPKNQEKPQTKPVRLMGAIFIPGNPLRFDISWVDQATGRYYLGEAGNASVDVIDARNDLYLGRITGFHGVGAPDDPCGPTQGMGPSGVLVTSNNQLWATDAHGIVKVFDLNNATPPFNLNPIATIPTGAQCRADEIGFDPKDHLIVVGNPSEKPPVAVVISAEPPYTVLAKIPFSGARGFEQPVWDPELKGGRMLATVPGESGMGEVAVINFKDPKSPIVETVYQTPNCGSGLALGPSQHLLVGCGGGNPNIIIDGLTGKMIVAVDQSHGADEVWYNSGDRNFYAPSRATQMVSVIDANTGDFITNLPAGAGVHSVAAFRENNHVFVPIAPPTAAVPADPCNTMFGFPPKQGCVFVYAHEE